MKKKIKKNFTLEQAIEFATTKHKDQSDKAKQPYINHPLNVMNQLQGAYSKMAGVLHDVVEDTDTTFEDLEKMGCPEIVISALKLVTHPQDYKGTEEEYMNAILAIAASGNQIAIDVKWADLTHNSDISRLKNPEEKDYERLGKYQKSKDILKPFISDYLQKPKAKRSTQNKINQNSTEIKYPRYYNVDDVPIMIELDGNEVVGHCANGMPYPIGKAFVDGYQINKEKYEALAKELYGINFLRAQLRSNIKIKLSIK